MDYGDCGLSTASGAVRALYNSGGPGGVCIYWLYAKKQIHFPMFREFPLGTERSIPFFVYITIYLLSTFDR